MANYLNLYGKEMGTVNAENRKDVRYIIVETQEDINEEHLDVFFGITTVGYYFLDMDTNTWVNLDEAFEALNKIKETMMYF